jgi:hypothetical protein
MPSVAIPQIWEAEVLAKAAEGWSTRKIAAWIETDKGKKVGYVSVARLLKNRRGERAEVAKIVLREKLGSSLTTDIDRLERHASTLDRLAMARAAAGDDEVYAKLVEQLRKITDTKLHFSGAGEADDKTDATRGIVVCLPPEE